ncbi:hypothetical protein [Luteolibacter luteus]|uniref:Uncharacterized protein n=1 Tax=Luteolibacter luteus TaxID=2728835 RepID=A0A858RRY3_9BACT|nr:hypothetical protein [Luteolibacter luteus]QJE98890.1 hypothetical protein HHL09_24950 [Luteolibacter luteus]
MKPLLLLALGCSAAFGQLGKTPEECAKRYGPPGKLPQKDQIGYESGGFLIRITFAEGKARAASFHKKSSKGEITDAEVAALLAGFAGGSPWTRDEATTVTSFQRWITEDHKLVAHRYRQSVEIMSSDQIAK